MGSGDETSTTHAWELVDNFYHRNEGKRATFLTQVEVWWGVRVKVPEGVRPSPAKTGQL